MFESDADTQTDSFFAAVRRPGHSGSMTALTTKDERFAALAATLSRAAGVGGVALTDAARVIRHELRRRNTNASLRATRRFKEGAGGD